MKKYIEIEAIRSGMIRYGFIAPHMTVTEFIEDKLPSADVAEVRHGRWIPTNATHIQKGAIYSRCSVCNEYVTVVGHKLRYCPNCGAKMEV